MSEVVDITKLVENDVAQFLAKSEKKREFQKESSESIIYFAEAIQI